MQTPVHIRVVASIDSLPILQEFVLSTADNMHIDEERRGHLRLLVEELFINICTHGQYATYVDFCLQKKYVNYQAEAHNLSYQEPKVSLHCFMRDDGVPFNPLRQNSDSQMPSTKPSANLADIPLKNRDFGGMGLILLYKLAKHTNYSYLEKENYLSFEL